jgi:hypothetical protein
MHKFLILIHPANNVSPPFAKRQRQVPNIMANQHHNSIAHMVGVIAIQEKNYSDLMMHGHFHIIFDVSVVENMVNEIVSMSPHVNQQKVFRIR